MADLRNGGPLPFMGYGALIWLDLLPWQRGCPHTQLHQAPSCRTMLSHLCCLMNANVTLRCLQSSFTVSIHLFLGLLVPCTYPWSASFGYLVWSILCTWPKYCIRCCCIRFAMSWSRPTLSHTSLFLILSLRVTPAILLKQDISVFLCLHRSPSFRVIHQQCHAPDCQEVT